MCRTGTRLWSGATGRQISRRTGRRSAVKPAPSRLGECSALLLALGTAEDLAFLEDLEERIDLEEARKALAEGGDSIPWEKVKAELAL